MAKKIGKLGGRDVVVEPTSPYVEMFGVREIGRPAGSEASPGVPGNPKLTAKAHRRAVQVLKGRHGEEYLEILKAEIERVCWEEGTTPAQERTRAARRHAEAVRDAAQRRLEEMPA